MCARGALLSFGAFAERRGCCGALCLSGNRATTALRRLCTVLNAPSTPLAPLLGGNGVLWTAEISVVKISWSYAYIRRDPFLLSMGIIKMGALQHTHVVIAKNFFLIGYKYRQFSAKNFLQKKRTKRKEVKIPPSGQDFQPLLDDYLLIKKACQGTLYVAYTLCVHTLD